jgi:hypothetical protein
MFAGRVARLHSGFVFLQNSSYLLYRKTLLLHRPSPSSGPDSNGSWWKSLVAGQKFTPLLTDACGPTSVAAHILHTRTKTLNDFSTAHKLRVGQTPAVMPVLSRHFQLKSYKFFRYVMSY